MTYVITDECIKCTYTDCVKVCPVDCFYEGELMLVINPKECIDCGVCESECPVKAIRPESADLIDWIETSQIFYFKMAKYYYEKPALPNAHKYKDENNKFKKYMSDTYF